MSQAEILSKPYARMVLPDGDGSFSAEIFEFPGCIATGSTAAEALANLESVAEDWVAAALAQGQSIPEPMDAAGYSGKLVVRMSKGLHRRAALWAERDGVSLNQFIVSCIAEQVGERARPLVVHPQEFQTALTVNLQFGSSPVQLQPGGLMQKPITAQSGGASAIRLPVRPKEVEYA